MLAGSFPEDANDYPGKQVVVEHDPNEFEGMIYQLSEQSFTWEEAQAYAAEQGAEIPFIEPGDPVLPFLGKLWEIGPCPHGSTVCQILSWAEIRSLRFAVACLHFSFRTFPVLLAWEKPEILLPE